MTSSNQVTILDSTFDRDGPKVMFGIEPRIRRIFEFAAAATGAVLLAPIFLMAAIAIKLRLSRSDFHSRFSTRAQQPSGSSF